MAAPDTAPLDIDRLRADEIASAVALWHEAGLTRPWNDPVADAHRALGCPNATILAGRIADRLVGTALVGEDGHRGWVYYLAVAADRRALGYGRVLMRAAEAWVAARGIAKMNVMVRTDNAGIAAFYRAVGYEQSEVSVLARWLKDPDR